MAKLPEYLSQTQAAPGNAPRAGADSFGGGQGLIALGSAINNQGANADALIKAQAERDATAYVAEQSSKLQLDSLKALEAMKTDGQDINTFSDRFQAQYDENAKALVDNAPNPLAQRAMQEHVDTIKTSMGEKATMFQATEKIGVLKNSSVAAANNIANLAFADPANADEYRRQLAVLQDSSNRYMTPSESQAFITKSNSEFATSRIRAALAVDPNAAEKLLKSQEFTSQLTNESFVSLSNKIDARKEALANQALAQQNQNIKDFQDDPAALSATNGADMTDPQDIIDKQKLKNSDGSEVKVQPNNISLIPKQQASFLANQLNGINNADTMVANLESIKKQYGEKYFPIAMRDLKNNGLSADAAFIAYMDPVQDKHIIDASFAIDAAGAKKGEGIKVITDMAKTRAATQGDKISDLDTKVAQNIQDIAGAMTAEGIPGNEINNIQTRASNIASYLYTKSGDINTAAKQATDWMTAKYNMGDVNGKKFRAPPAYNVNQIESGLEATLKDIKPSDITTVNSVGSSDFMMQNLKSRGYFTLNGDQSGYILRDEFGIPVRSADKVNVFQVPIKDAILKNADVNQKRAKQNTNDNVKFLQEAP
jgi:hypothetical protein